MSGYTKPCIFCNQEIRMSNDSGSWLPYEINTNEVHKCKDKQPQPQQKQVQEHKSSSTLTLEELDARLKRVERIVLGTN